MDSCSYKKIKFDFLSSVNEAWFFVTNAAVNVLLNENVVRGAILKIISFKFFGIKDRISFNVSGAKSIWHGDHVSHRPLQLLKMAGKGVGGGTVTWVEEQQTITLTKLYYPSRKRSPKRTYRAKKVEGTIQIFFRRFAPDMCRFNSNSFRNMPLFNVAVLTVLFI